MRFGKNFFPKPLKKDKRAKSEHFQRLDENVSEIAARRTGDYVTSMLVFRAEKRSARKLLSTLIADSRRAFLFVDFVFLCRSV